MFGTIKHIYIYINHNTFGNYNWFCLKLRDTEWFEKQEYQKKTKEWKNLIFNFGKVSTFIGYILVSE